MQLFLAASMPLFFALVLLLQWDRRVSPKMLTLVTTFLKGVLLFFPGYLILLLARRIFGFSYEGFLLYLSLLLRDHLAPVLVALGGFLLVQRRMALSGTDEATFLAVFSFLAGFMAMVNIADLLRAWGAWDGYVLFVLPALRIDAVLLMALAAQSSYRWEGRDGWLFAAVASALAVGLTLSSFLYRVNLAWGAIAGMIAPLLAGIALFALRFPRAVRG